MSRLPLKNPKTFGSFDFSVVKGKDVDRLEDLQTLSSIHSHRNLAFIGPAGTGKTHLAQAFGYECCIHGLKTYFIKMSELRDRFTLARRSGTEARTIAFCAARRSLMRYQRSDGVPAVGPRSGLLASCDCHVVVFCHPLEKRV